MRVLFFVMSAGLALLQTSCAHYTVKQTTRPGQVYVVYHSAFSSDEVYSCDARNNAPVCYRVQEFERR